MERIELKKRILTSSKYMKHRSENCVTFEFVEKNIKPCQAKVLYVEEELTKNGRMLNIIPPGTLMKQIG